MEAKEIDEKQAPPPEFAEDGLTEGEMINVSGHVQELDRKFGLWSICAIGILSDNAWGAGGGALTTALYNGGGPGVLYGLIAATFFYVLIGASLAELASAIPSSACVYHWASVTAGPKFGRITSFYAGWWNCLAWVFGSASSSAFAANAIVAMYALYHPDYTPQRWQIFIAFIGITWLDCAIVLFGQRVLPKFATAGGCICMAAVFIIVMVCAIMPSQTGYGYATNAFVWTEWQNGTGWSSNGYVFVAGMLNGAFAIGTPDGVSHLAEEIPDPKRNIPKGIVAQLTTGFITTFCFYIAILYAVTNLEDVYATNIVSLPLAALFQQAARSNAGTCGLLFIFLLDVVITIPGAQITAGRMLWTMARDDAVPFSNVFSRVSPKWRNPFWAQVAVACCITILGCIYVGSLTAFNAFIGVFAIFTTMSYLAAILPHILTKRKYVKPGPFWMHGITGYLVIGTASAYIIVWNIIFMFPYALPVDAATMNYSVVMSGGITILLGGWYLWKRTRGYVGPRVDMDASNDIMTGLILSPTNDGRRQSIAADGKRRSIVG